MTLAARKRETAASLAGKYLPITIRGKTYGIRCANIRAQAGLHEMLERPDLPSRVAGFITRRGRLIPVLDLHRVAVGESVPPMDVTIVVVQTHPESNPELPVGLCVDKVGSPVQIEAADIEICTEHRQGADAMPCLAKVRGAVGALLDLDAIVEQSIFRQPALTRA